MNKFAIKFYSLKSTSDLVLESTKDISGVVLELMSIFATEVDTDNLRMKVDRLQRNTIELKTKIVRFVEKYKEISPQLNRFKTYFDKLDVNEHFFILDNAEITTEQSLFLSNYLVSLKNDRDFDKINADTKEIFECVLRNYDVFSYDITKKIKIGDRPKKKRICRFCKKQHPEVAFLKEAHAISEALGNKTLIINEECDTCNKFFDEQIERDIINYFSIYRTFFGIKGKQKIPKLKGTNFVYEHQGNRQISISVTGDPNTYIDEPPLNIKMEMYNKISLQNIYKALCKFALSIIDGKYVKYFDRTINWIRNDIYSGTLPKVAVLSSYHFFNTHPNLILYIRKNDNTELPFAVGEFHFTFLVYVFIIPYSNQDNTDFCNEDNYHKYWECFQHYKRSGEWSFNDYNDSRRKKLTFDLNLKKSKKA